MFGMFVHGDWTQVSNEYNQLFSWLIIYDIGNLTYGGWGKNNAYRDYFLI